MFVLQKENGFSVMMSLYGFSSQFLSYYCEWFDDDSEIFWFRKFKKIVKENFKLMDTDDMDYDAVKEICRSQVKDMYAVALICYDHNQTYFREQVMTWVDLAQGE